MTIRKFFEWLRKCVEWSVFLWNDSDFDRSPILKVLQYKVKRNREHMESHKIHTNWKKTARRMRIFEMILDRLISEDYNSIIWNRINAEEDSFIDSDGMLTYCPSEERRKLIRSLSGKERYLINQDIDMLAHYLKKYYPSWWC